MTESIIENITKALISDDKNVHNCILRGLKIVSSFCRPINMQIRRNIWGSQHVYKMTLYMKQWICFFVFFYSFLYSTV